MGVSSHGSTFGGNPLASAVANAVLDVMLAPGFLDHVVAMGGLLRARLSDLSARHPEKIAEVRGQGLMVGLRTVEGNAEVATRLREAGLLTVPAADNVLRLLPPLTVSAEEIGLACDILAEACRAKAA
jgi:acetylornithine/N-succinyldiaminopimelate aminotransferase